MACGWSSTVPTARPASWRPAPTGAWVRRSSRSTRPRTATTSTGCWLPHGGPPARGGGAWCRSGHRPRRRRRSLSGGGRGGAHRRWRSDDGHSGVGSAAPRSTDRRHPGRDGHEQPGPTAGDDRARRRVGGHRGRRPLRARRDARPRLRAGWRAVRPHRAGQPRDHRRRSADGVVIDGGDGRSRAVRWRIWQR